MPTYLSPGVYVEENLSGSTPIVGVGTSIAAFIGTIQATSSGTKLVRYNLKKIVAEEVGDGNGNEKTFPLAESPVDKTSGKFTVKVGGTE